MKKWIWPVAAVAVIGAVIFSDTAELALDVPEVIEIKRGEAFSVDDYVDIRGRKDDVTLEYIDDININIPGTYTLDIIAEDSRGERLERTVKVIVED